MDELAKDLGVMPDVGAMMNKPSQWLTAFRILFGGTTAAQYFLEGPDASVSASRVLSRL